jgi:hypothetical protein
VVAPQQNHLLDTYGHIEQIEGTGLQSMVAKVVPYQSVLGAIRQARFASSLQIDRGAKPGPHCGCAVDVFAIAGHVVTGPDSEKRYAWAILIVDPASGRTFATLGSDKGTWPGFFDALPNLGPNLGSGPSPQSGQAPG